jgi:ComF family protein
LQFKARVFRTTLNSLVRLLLAPACAACGGELERPLESPVCAACWRQVASVGAPWCARCGDELERWADPERECARCRQHPPRFHRARSAGRYDGALRDVIHAFKYDKRRVLAEPLGRMMRESGADLLQDADAVVPVPLHPIRAVRRGFNQADDLARQLGLPVWRVLRRRRHGPPQAGLAASVRLRNLEAAFGVSAGWTLTATARRRALDARTVVLVDDVMTTGATVDACSAVLLANGVRSVRVLTAARAVTARPIPPPPPPHLSAHPRR